MTKLYIICGHGGRDTGAKSGIYKEADLVRKLARRINELAGKEVVVCDTSINFYQLRKMNTYRFPKGAQVLELHLDSSKNKSARGGHIIIHQDFKPDKYDLALAEMLEREFPGRANTIVRRNDLYNMCVASERGISYRLMECCFISNKKDLKKFRKEIDSLANEILECFGISKSKSYLIVAKEVIAGKWGNGSTRKKKLEKAGYDYVKVQAEVNRLLKK